MTTTPQQLSYRTTKPQGFPSNIKETTFTPVSSMGSFGPGDTIRFEIRSSSFLDPYTTRLNFEVLVLNEEADTDWIKQVDGSAHSFISELLITSRGIDIERVQEYDVLSSILHDMNWTASHRKARVHEGHGLQELSVSDFHVKEAADFKYSSRNCNSSVGGSALNNKTFDPTFLATGYGLSNPDIGNSVKRDIPSVQNHLKYVTGIVRGVGGDAPGDRAVRGDGLNSIARSVQDYFSNTSENYKQRCLILPESGWEYGKSFLSPTDLDIKNKSSGFHCPPLEVYPGQSRMSDTAVNYLQFDGSPFNDAYQTIVETKKLSEENQARMYNTWNMHEFHQPFTHSYSLSYQDCYEPTEDWTLSDNKKIRTIKL